MRIYNPKHWFGILFQFHKSDTLRKLYPLIIAISLYATGVVYLEIYWLNLSEKSPVKNIFYLHNLLGFALSLLLVFRTNTAYDRWWEGRKQWGSLTNNSRNLAIKLQAFLQPTDEHNRKFFRQAIPLYAKVLSEHLLQESTRFALDDEENPEFKAIDYTKHAPNQVARLINDKIAVMYKQKVISGEQLIFLNNEVSALTDICGACERIKNTPIPYSYSAFIKKFFFIYIMTLPFGYVFTLGFWVVPVVAIVFYVLGSLELIAEEIEDPFGRDSNDLPMAKLAENIRKHVAEII
ncbi:MAG TPA: bestrophin family ion channel [Flavipsychrobacter sp.]|nr:bestrophin family ion channel [Flavipsychrobacter sp.]